MMKVVYSTEFQTTNNCLEEDDLKRSKISLFLQQKCSKSVKFHKN